MVNRIQQEVRIHSELKHPSILELYAFFEDANYVYLVLELAHNGELYSYMKNQQRVMTEVETAAILHQVVNGLLYLKSQNILHRDMSLSNLLLTKDQKVKIADFGLATRLTRSDEKHRTMCGTPNYISPEVASRASHGLPVDVWGLGCMMYTLLVGNPPFDSDCVPATLTKVCMSDLKIPMYLSMEAKDLLTRLLCKNPVQRIHIDDVLAHSFMAKSYKYNNTMASVDSGLVTMSSGLASSHHIAGKLGVNHSRSRSEERNQYQHLPFSGDQMERKTNSSHFLLGYGDGVAKWYESMELSQNNSVFGGHFSKPSSGNNGMMGPVLNTNPADTGGGGWIRSGETANANFYGQKENQNQMVSFH